MAPAKAPRTRQERADDTRGRLFLAAAELFADEGYHATTVERIAKRANVAKGTFFVHFASKASVVVSLVRIQTDGAKAERERVARAGGSAVERLRATVTALGAQAGVNRTLSRAVLAAGLESPEVGEATDALFRGVFDLMIADVRDAQRARELAAQPDAETLAGILMASYLGAALSFATSPLTSSLMATLTPLLDATLGAPLPSASKPAPKSRSKKHKQ